MEYVTLNNGVKMPVAGIGTFLLTPDEAENSVAPVSYTHLNRPIDEKTIVFGEVGLSGEVRAVSMPEQRVAEAKKLGFETCILPEVSLKMVKDIRGIRLIGVKNIGDAVGIF